MAAPLPPLELATTIAPSASTGSDAHGQNQGFEFGNISFGPEPTHWAFKAVRDVAVGLAVALAAKYVIQQVTK